jgi:uncharacterized protein YndB with AHSA1/START domain
VDQEALHARDALTVIRTLQARPHQVFAVWTDPALIRRWGAGAASIDPRVGGRIRRATGSARGLHTVTGEYREVESGRRLVMAWLHDDRRAATIPIETVVTVDLRACGIDRTEMRISERPIDPEDRTDLESAWTEVLDALDPLLAHVVLADAR